SEAPLDSGVEAPAVPSRPGRNAKGQFLKGNYEAITHALRATRLPPELQHLPAEIAEWMANVAADEGDPDEIPTPPQGLLEYRGRIHRRIVQLDTALELRGLIDKRGKLRVAWLQQLSSLISTAKSLDQLLGLERRPKKVQSLDEIFAEAAREAEAETESA